MQGLDVTSKPYQVNNVGTSFMSKSMKTLIKIHSQSNIVWTFRRWKAKSIQSKEYQNSNFKCTAHTSYRHAQKFESAISTKEEAVILNIKLYLLGSHLSTSKLMLLYIS